MKRVMYLAVSVVSALVLAPFLFSYSAAAAPAKATAPTTSAPKPTVVPKVPIEFATDTTQTITRRAEWMKAAKKEGTLVWWSILRPAEANPIIAEFNKLYPFIKVNHWRAVGAEQSTKAEGEWSAGRYTVDILHGVDPSTIPRYRETGIIDKYTDIIPGIEKVDKRNYGKYGDWVIVGHTILSPVYNTKLVTAAEAPKNWEDLADPKWKGQLGLTPDMKAWLTLAVGDGKAWGVEKVEQFLIKLRQQDLIWAASKASGHSLLLAGEYKVFGDDYMRYVFVGKARNQPSEWVKTNPIVVDGPPMVLVKKAPNPSAAKLFLEWLLSPQGLIKYEEVTSAGSVYPGSGTKTSKLVEGSEIVARTEEATMRMIEQGLDAKFIEALGTKGAKIRR